MNQDRYAAILVRLLLRVNNFEVDAPFIQYYSTGEIAITGTHLLRLGKSNNRYVKYPHLFPSAVTLLNSLTTVGFIPKRSLAATSSGVLDQITYQGKKVALVNYHE